MAKRGLTKSQKRQIAFGEHYEYMSQFTEGERTKRLHPIVSDYVDEKIREESNKLDLTIGDYILYAAVMFKVDDIPAKLDSVIEKLDNYMKINKIPYNKKNKGATIMSEIQKFNDEKGQADKKQFHLRITPEAYEEVERRAAQFSMSLSDYIVFVTTSFDIMEISKKLDEINSKLDAINGKEQ